MMRLRNLYPFALPRKAAGPVAGAEEKGMTVNELAEYLLGPVVAGKVSVTQESAMRLSSVFACVRVLGFTFSYLPWNLFSVGSDGEKELATTHPVQRLINLSPNGFQTPAAFKTMMMVHALQKGNFLAFKVKDNRGNTIELLPLDPDTATIRRKDDWTVEYEINVPGVGRKKYSKDDIFHFYLLSFDGFSGVSVLKYARECIGQGIAMQNYGAALFENGARPDYAIEVPRGTGKEALKNLKDDWVKLFSGPNNAGRPAWLEDGMKLQTMSLNNDDVQFLETKGFTRSEIAGFYGVPPHLIGDLSKATFSNIEHQDLSYLKYALMPWINQAEECARLQLLAPHEQITHSIDINENRLRRGDLAAQTTFMQAAVGRPPMTVNEWRRENGMNPISGGDDLALQAGIGDGRGQSEDTDNDA